MRQFTATKVWDVVACFELFKTAVEGKKRALLRGLLNGATHEHQIRFMRYADKPEGRGVWVEVLEGDRRALELEYRQKTAVEVSFSAEDAMAFFDTVIEQRQTTLIFRERRLLLRAPNKISVVQQRKDGRVWVPERTMLKSRLSKHTVDQDDQSATIIPGRVWDLSLSGASFICPTDPMLIGLRQDERLELELEYPGGIKINRTAGVCYARPLSMRSVRLGVQFVKGEGQAEVDDAELRRLLQELEAVKARAQLYDDTLEDKLVG
jgi:hypothetical protein